MTIRDLKKGDYFTKKPTYNPKEQQVFIRGDYDRTTQRYECYRFDDINNTCFLKGDREVYTEFTF